MNFPAAPAARTVIIVRQGGTHRYRLLVVRDHKGEATIADLARMGFTAWEVSEVEADALATGCWISR